MIGTKVPCVNPPSTIQRGFTFTFKYIRYQFKQLFTVCKPLLTKWNKDRTALIIQDYTKDVISLTSIYDINSHSYSLCVNPPLLTKWNKGKSALIIQDYTKDVISLTSIYDIGDIFVRLGSFLHHQFG